MTTQSSSLRLADRLAKQPYSWPGGYPIFAVMDDGGCLCSDCAKTERESIATTTGRDGWCVTALAPNWEDKQLYCCHCSARISAAYE